MLRKVLGRAPLIAVIAAAAAVSGCGHHKPEVKKEEAYVERPVDLLYRAGAQRLDQRHWNEAIDYFQEVERQHPYSEWSRRSILMQAYAHYEANQYEDAVADADRFVQLYPGSPNAAYAFYLKSICYFEQIMDVQRDQGSTRNALAALRDVVQRYPNTGFARDAKVKIDMVNDQLAGKEMEVGRWYLKQGQPLAAVGRFRTVIDKYQTTSHTPEALYRLVEADLTLGLTDEAKRNGAVLGYNYPGGVWYQDAYRLLERRGLQPDQRPAKASKRRADATSKKKTELAVSAPG